jgi:GNAT superfamily N-acetyltransferase
MLNLVDRLSNAAEAESVERTQKGRPGVVRPVIRPVSAADLGALGGFFGGLSVRTRTRRFFAPVRPGPAMLARLARTGGTADGALADGEAVVATWQDAIIGHAMAVDGRRRDGERTAEIGVVVADAWQHRGVGAALVRALLAGAQARGATWLTMDVLPGNDEVLAMITGHWAPVRTGRAADCVTVHVPLPRPAVRGDADVTAPGRMTAAPGRMTAAPGRMTAAPGRVTAALSRA